MNGAILQFFPERLDVNGDAQNALVLAQRARWAGIPVELVRVEARDRLPTDRPAAVVLGSSVDAEVAGVRADLASYAGALGDWMAEGVPVLAVGTGWEILAEQVDLESGSIEGLGLLPGRAVRVTERATGDLVVDTAVGRLVGFENHARGFSLPADAESWGAVVRGIGNGGLSSSGTLSSEAHNLREGSVRGATLGTHLHGPVLAKNPAVADAMLSDSFGPSYSATSPEASRADSLAASARALILGRLQLADRP
jgi:CobQ-like glutamine amidotransferase family enzyme